MLVVTAAFLMLVILGPFLSFNPDGANTGEGNVLRQAGYVAIFLLAIVAAQPFSRAKPLNRAQPYNGAARSPGLPLSLLLALGWCWLSLTWAVDPAIALRRLLLTTMTIGTIFLIVGQLGYRSAVVAMRLALVAVLLANYAAVLGWPSVGIHPFGLTEDAGLTGDWRGIAQHKNFVGPMCAFTILLFLLDARRVPALLRWSVVIAAAFFLYRSDSKTSMGILAVSLVAAWSYARYRPRYRPLLVAGSMILAIALPLLLYSYGDSLSAAFASPDALTGRVQIWPVLIAYSRDHWMQGSGYGSFWNIGSASPAYEYATGWVSTIASGHNGYLDLLVQIGAPGLLLVIASAIVVPVFRLLASGTMSRQHGALLIALVLFCAGHNLTESSLFDRDTLVQVVLMFAVALIGTVTSPAARRPAAGESVPARG